MKVQPIVVTASNGEKRKAGLAVCECGSNTWHVFDIRQMAPGEAHQHLQCANCSETFCANGAACSAEPHPEAINAPH